MAATKGCVVPAPVCADCSPAWLAWLDYRLPPPPIQLLVIGNRVQDIQDRQESRYRQWRDTIRSQQALIERSCARRHGAAA